MKKLECINDISMVKDLLERISKFIDKDRTVDGVTKHRIALSKEDSGYVIKAEPLVIRYTKPASSVTIRLADDDLFSEGKESLLTMEAHNAIVEMLQALLGTMILEHDVMIRYYTGCIIDITRVENMKSDMGLGSKKI